MRDEHIQELFEGFGLTDQITADGVLEALRAVRLRSVTDEHLRALLRAWRAVPRRYQRVLAMMHLPRAKAPASAPCHLGPHASLAIALAPNRVALLSALRTYHQRRSAAMLDRARSRTHETLKEAKRAWKDAMEVHHARS